MSESPSTNERPIVVLGAGIAGLTTAYHILKSRGPDASERVIVLEKEERPGGLAVSVSQEGIHTYMLNMEKKWAWVNWSTRSMNWINPRPHQNHQVHG